MFSFSYKNRIAFNYILSTGLLISVVFFVIYQIIDFSVNTHINDDIQMEVEKHLEEIEIDRNNTYLIQVDQWRAREHNTVNVNPVFVQFFDINDKLIDKSPNLKGLQLKLYVYKLDNKFIDTYLNNKPIRQIQVPLFDNKKVVGHLFVAMSLDDATMILTNLRNTLFIAFPLILIVLFLIARLIAGRSIKPVTMITETSSRITKDNLKDRIELPHNKDELYVLSKTINDLLDRIESAVEREKQFTSDASHELRTPLTVLKGTLEVLIRKPRSQSEYEEKINYSISEVNRLNNLVDQLLLLARFENQKQSLKIEKVYLNALILDTLTLYSEKINNEKINIKYSFSTDYFIKSDNYLVSIIISNIISNAIKYSYENGEISILLSKENNKTICSISDNGIGIAKDDLDKIFNPFYRSNPTNHPEIKGSGLGLSIVKRITQLLHIGFEIHSEINQGTTVILRIS
ncbi:HAMP domain-containing sensor histidine kinase [Flavobacterium gawalongense]|uniref:histidine kinase n=1 Tax=Flavobacterium gawalongense TaxID=2594432 RepID=A0A553BGK1_9FLAO|nr:ATP-binding protein [Flavobacterium gawalongense]TRX00003.1 HAMP domain-containing protein [Flavobacterium gawalongense]TRX04767.1 HAMP domain-containing protein [Flavobacterium gawalongense]TRX07353.1 HAMP domain-containing protein [Flavobacterium gawalongense]TRX08370.1 HAMP domain-containing protein [Flavobacterium gawalongense]TRX24441.1 HAMP domain-containing protein [Flavobacterium gawalongense]